MTSQVNSTILNQSYNGILVDDAKLIPFLNNTDFLDVVKFITSVKGIVFLSLAYYASWIIYTRTFHPLAKFPGPFLASVSRAWIIKDIIKQHSDKTQRNLHDKHGPIVRIAPDELTISDPKAISIIYSIKKGFPKTDFWLPLQGKNGRYHNHVCNLDEVQHAARRRIVSNIYTMNNVLKSEEYIDICVAEFMRNFERFAQTGETVDLARWTQLFSFDVIGELYFSKMFGFMEKNQDYQDLIKSIDTIMPYLTISQVSPRWIRPIMMSPVLFSRARKAVGGLQKIWVEAGISVAEREKILEEGKTPRQDMLGQLFSIYYEKGSKVDYNKIDIQSEVRGALTAGSDTTGIAITAAFYYLMKHPVFLHKLVQEIDSATAEGKLSVPYVKYSEAVALPFLNACCKESMRFYPSAAMHLPRHVQPEWCMIAGQWIPGGTRVGINPAVVLRDKDVFGEDADSFNPERWFTPKGEHMDKYMFQFGAGSKTCLGKNIALAEIYKLVPQVLRSFELVLVEPDRILKTINYGFHKINGCEIKIRKRQL